MSGVEGVTVAGFILPGFIILVSFGLGLGLALGFGGGGGVASERARVWCNARGCHPRPDSARMCESDTENEYWGSGGYVSM